MNSNAQQSTIVKILYFARLRETLGKAEEELSLPDGVRSIGALVTYLRARGGDWETALGAGKAVRVAVNQDIANSDTPIVGTEEIAFFPPVTGG